MALGLHSKFTKWRVDWAVRVLGCMFALVFEFQFPPHLLNHIPIAHALEAQSGANF
jgi:hypothetical protein